MKLTNAIESQIKEDALKRVKKLNLHKRANLHLYEQVLEAGDERSAAALGVSLERDSALVFVDLAPAYNWAHPCEYHLYDATTGRQYQETPASLPPPILNFEGRARTAFHAPVKMIDTPKRRSAWKKRIPLITNSLSSAPGERYAILFAGKAENRHTNDLEFLYRTLIDDYGFAAGNIQVLNYDGTLNYGGAPNPIGNWPGDNTAYRLVVNHPGTRAGFQAAFNAIAARIRPEDFLFIHTNNHGGGPCDQGRDVSGVFDLSDYCMYTYDANGSYWIPYYVNDFITDLGLLPHFEVLMVMMEQCRSGGFINPIINSNPATWTHVGTAVTSNDYSQGGINFDPFAEDWIAGIHGRYPDNTGLQQAVDTNHDGRLSAAETFHYADAVHSYSGGILKYCPAPQGTPLRIGDTPTFSDSPSGFGAYIFPGLPAHDLYLRDNLQDHGREPLIGGGIACSPDIVVFNQELLDPEATLGTPTAQQCDTLGNQVESGQDNYVYLRVQNRGSQPTGGTARLYWSKPSVLPTPNSWTEITDPANPITVPSVNPGEMKIVGPIVWHHADIPAQGHYCFVGLINSGNDPSPDPATIHTIDDYYNFIRQSNNATWRNFDVTDIFKNSVANIEFVIQGWPRIKLAADLFIDLSALPADIEAKLRILKRLSAIASPENMYLIEESGLYQKFQVKSGHCAHLCGMNLKPSDNIKTWLDLTIPEGVPDSVYRVSLAQIVDGREMGRVTRALNVGEYPFLANSNSNEVHIATCTWAHHVAPSHKVAYKELEHALKHGFNGCRYCLPEYSSD